MATENNGESAAEKQLLAARGKILFLLDAKLESSVLMLIDVMRNLTEIGRLIEKRKEIRNMVTQFTTLAKLDHRSFLSDLQKTRLVALEGKVLQLLVSFQESGGRTNLKSNVLSDAAMDLIRHIGSLSKSMERVHGAKCMEELTQVEIPEFNVIQYSGAEELLDEWEHMRLKHKMQQFIQELLEIRN